MVRSISFYKFLPAMIFCAVVYQNCSEAEIDLSNITTPGQGAFNFEDADGDGLSDESEEAIGTNPNMRDTDGDGLIDSLEVNGTGTNPLVADTDGGGVVDGVEVDNGTNAVNDPSDDILPARRDPDRDGLTNDQEASLGTNPDVFDTDGDGLSDGSEVSTYFTDPLDPDTDEGGMNDGFEVARGQNPRDNPVDDRTVVDTDFDGLPDTVEAVFGTDPNVQDTDGDWLFDGAEVFVFLTDPLMPDTDSGGVKDGNEVAMGTNPLQRIDDTGFDPNDTDRDGLTDGEELLTGTNPNSEDSDFDGLRDGIEVRYFVSNPLVGDTDGGGVDDKAEASRGNRLTSATDDDNFNDRDLDGLTDSQESYVGTNPDNPDSDGDGLMDGEEILNHRTNPNMADTDGGGVSDGVEISFGLDPKDSSDDVGLDSFDTDGDGLINSDERGIGTDPMNADTDGDGLTDGAEFNTFGTDPLNPDTDGGGVNDGPEISAGQDPLNPADD